jgi:hypothetical protein
VPPDPHGTPDRCGGDLHSAGFSEFTKADGLRSLNRAGRPALSCCSASHIRCQPLGSAGSVDQLTAPPCRWRVGGRVRVSLGQVDPKSLVRKGSPFSVA